MRRLLQSALALLILVGLFFTAASTAYASEGTDEHAMEMEVNGYHVSLTSQNDWQKGENTIVVTLMDSMGMPVRNADVEILIAPKADGHAEETHAAESQHDSMPGMEMDTAPTEASMPGMDMGSEQTENAMPGMDMSAPAEEMPAHNEDAISAMSMTESDEQGMYTVDAHFESAGEHEVSVMFHVNGEMLQADFIVEILRTLSKTFVLWAFVLVNILVLLSAGIMKKQPVPVKGTK